MSDRRSPPVLGVMRQKGIFMQPTVVQIVVTVASALAAIISATVAVVNSNRAAREASKHAATAEKYAQALKSIIDLGEYSKHLRGMETTLEALTVRTGDVITISKRLETIADKTSETVIVAGKEITKSLQVLSDAAKLVEEISKELGRIANATRKSQRQSELAHRLLIREIRGRETPFDEEAAGNTTSDQEDNNEL
jgi:hypothetical protein